MNVTKKPSHSVNGENYLDKLNVYQLLKKNSAEEIISFPARQIYCEGTIWMELP
jgi:hypothetical protein